MSIILHVLITCYDFAIESWIERIKLTIGELLRTIYESGASKIQNMLIGKVGIQILTSHVFSTNGTVKETFGKKYNATGLIESHEATHIFMLRLFLALKFLLLCFNRPPLFASRLFPPPGFSPVSAFQEEDEEGRDDMKYEYRKARGIGAMSYSCSHQYPHCPVDNVTETVHRLITQY